MGPQGNQRHTGIAYRKQQKNVWIGKKIWPFYKKKQ